MSILANTRRTKQKRQPAPLKAISSKSKIYTDHEEPVNRNRWRSESPKSRVNRKAGQPVLLQPLFKDRHPFPYIKTADVYLLKPLKDDDAASKVPLQEDIVEKFILDSKFANEFFEGYLPAIIEPIVRETVLSFTNRQGPANKPLGRDIASAPLQFSKPSHDKSKRSTEDEIADDLIAETVATILRPILWHCLDERSIFLEESKYQQILSNDRGYAVPPDLIPKLKQHCTRIAQGIKTKKWPADYPDFKGIPTKNYIYNLHKLWREQMTADNYAEHQLQLQFINEAIWHHFSNETLDSAKLSLKHIDLEEHKANSLLETK